MMRTFSGICFDQPTGRVCLWEIDILFRRGTTTGTLGLSAEKSFALHDVPHAVRLARKVLARWH